MSALLGSKRLMRTARQTLASLLQDARWAATNTTESSPLYVHFHMMWACMGTAVAWGALRQKAAAAYHVCCQCRGELQELEALPVKSPGVRQYQTALLVIVQHQIFVLADRIMSERARTQRAQAESRKRRGTWHN